MCLFLDSNFDEGDGEWSSELEAGVRSFHLALDDAIPRFKAKVAGPECDDVSTVVVEQLSDDMRKRLETERLTGCKIEYERDLKTGTWTATLVKLAGEGHGAVVGELAGQCGNYVHERNAAYQPDVTGFAEAVAGAGPGRRS